jgi:hypothetical protein
MSIDEKHKEFLARLPEAIKAAHKHSSIHRKEIEGSESCGCFYCFKIFTSSDIKEWIDEDETGVGQTARCPFCTIDSVIGSRSGYPIRDDFLEQMHRYWF